MDAKVPGYIPYIFRSFQGYQTIDIKEFHSERRIEVHLRAEEGRKCQVLDPKYIRGTGRFSNLMWDRGGNNDMMKGLLISFTAAHSILKPSDQELIQRIAVTAKNMLRLKHIQERDYNRGIVHGLVALYNNDLDEARAFINDVTGFKASMSDLLDIDSGFQLGGIADWSGVHLSMVSAISQVLMAEALRKKFKLSFDRFRFEQVKKAGEKRLLEMALTYRKSHLQYLDIFAYAYSRQVQENPHLSQKAMDSIFVLHEVPVQRNYPMAIEVDLEKWQDWSPSSWPRMPWKAVDGFTKIKDDISLSRHYQSTPGTLPFSADYLILYWVAKDSGLLK